MNSAVFMSETGGQPAPQPTAPAPTPAAPAASPATDQTSTQPAAEPNLLADALAGKQPGEPEPPAETPEQKAAREEAEKAAKQLKPEDYKLDEKTLPPGVKADDPLVTDFLAGAAKLGIPNEAVNGLLAQVAPKVAEQLAAPMKAYIELRDKWVNEAKAQFGAELPAVAARISQGIQRFAAAPGANAEEVAKSVQAVSQALVTTGAGNNPALISLLNRVFQRLSEGTPVTGSPVATQKPAASLLYDHPSSQQGGAVS